MKKNRVYIYTPGYDENSGGRIALHRLCHLLNQTQDFDAYLVPRKLEKIRISSIRNIIGSCIQYVRLEYERYFNFKVNHDWNTPIKRLRFVDDKDAIVVYPEITFGNPLQAKNVVRWLLHQPGHLKKEFCFGPGEIYFKFNTGVKDFNYCYSKTSENELKVIYYPLDIYNEDNVIERNINSYIIRKGKNKKMVHGKDYIPVDGLSHREVAAIMKKSSIFISYDDYTAYSIFAVLCGCKSVVVPGAGMGISEWYPNEKDRYGISYGFSDSQDIWSRETKGKVIEHIENEHSKSQERVIKCFNEAKSYFKL